MDWSICLCSFKSLCWLLHKLVLYCLYKRMFLCMRAQLKLWNLSFNIFTFLHSGEIWASIFSFILISRPHFSRLIVQRLSHSTQFLKVNWSEVENGKVVIFNFFRITQNHCFYDCHWEWTLELQTNNARWCLRIRERRSFPATLCLELHSTTAGSSSNIFLNVLRIYEGQSYSAENKWGFR